MQISAAFDGGNIEVVRIDGHAARLNIRADKGGEFFQWFDFQVVGALGHTCTFTLENAHAASYTDGWTDYQAVASYDRENWFRVPTTWDGAELQIVHRPAHDFVEYAYFAPYPLHRHADLVARSAAAGARVKNLGSTLDGRALPCLSVGQGLPVWIIARQHPGETMAEWWMEGFLGRLLNAHDALARSLLQRIEFHVVPNMNPDGSFRGHLRTNAAGVNLNRVWETPRVETEPEVFHVRNAMDATGVALCLDVHGDEALPYNFIAGAEGIPGWTKRQDRLTEQFKAVYAQANPDFQLEHGYPRDDRDAANMTMCTSQIAARFDCLSMTLEQPFKDNANLPDAKHGWSPERCRRLGASILDPISAVLSDLADPV